MVRVVFFALVIFCLPFVASADSGKVSEQLFESIHFAKNGNDLIVDLNSVKRLLGEGADPNWIDKRHKRHQSILLRFVELVSLSEDPRVAQEGFNAIQLLFENGARVQPVDRTILYYPVSWGNYEISKLLLERGVSAVSWPGDEIGTELTPIEVATSEGHNRIVDLLVRHGADRLSESDSTQERFVELAWMGSTSDLKILIERGARVNVKSKSGGVALINALSNRPDSAVHEKVVLLLAHGADPNIYGSPKIGDDSRPLHVAVFFSSFQYQTSGRDPTFGEKVLQKLLRAGAYVSSKDLKGRTPLHIAAERNHVYAARLLLASGAKVMPRDARGQTPLDLAESGEMITLLKKSGAKEL